MNPAIPRLLKEPVLQFLILGGGLFIAYASFAPPEAPPREEITVGAARIESLAANFERARRRRPTDQELDALIEDYIAEEVLYREALKLGLDQDDLIVRRRMRQKMELLLADALSAAPPGDDELRAQFEAGKDRYRKPGLLTFRQVYLGQKSEQADWVALTTRLNSDSDVDLASLGASSLLPLGMERATAAGVTGVFGAEFADALSELEAGQWSRPIESAYGWHLVRVDELVESADPAFEEVREEVARDLAYNREREARVELVERMKRNYEISVEDASK